MDITQTEELLVEILRFLDPSDLLTLLQVHRKCALICDISRLWLPHVIARWGIQVPEELVVLRESAYVMFRRARPLPHDFRGAPEIVIQREAVNDYCVSAMYPSVVGVGDRVLKSFVPFPAPQSLICKPLSFEASLKGLFDFIAANSRPSLACDDAWTPPATWRDHRASFFSSPVRQLLPTYHRSGAVLTAKSAPFAYFEVEISPSPSRSNIRQHGATDCVAVGLSTEEFPLQGYMPGWTDSSYGYHSDDGGVFHARGQMLREYGPRFGVGDVVGCGVYYPESSSLPAEIFFTLNGVYLGCAFVGACRPLYPTVGIDSNVSVVINTGLKPFRMNMDQLQYELEQPLQQQIVSNLLAQQTTFISMLRQPRDPWTVLRRLLDEADRVPNPSSLFVQFQQRFAYSN